MSLSGRFSRRGAGRLYCHRLSEHGTAKGIAPKGLQARRNGEIRCHLQNSLKSWLLVMHHPLLRIKRQLFVRFNLCRRNLKIIRKRNVIERTQLMNLRQRSSVMGVAILDTNHVLLTVQPRRLLADLVIGLVTLKPSVVQKTFPMRKGKTADEVFS